VPLRMIRRLGLIVLAILLATGCSSVSIPATYSKEERRATCLRTNGCWRPNLLDGYCEYKT